MNGLVFPRTRYFGPPCFAGLLRFVGPLCFAVLLGGPLAAFAQDPPAEPSGTVEAAVAAAVNIDPQPRERNRSAVIIPLHEDINPLSGALLKRKFKEAVDSDVDVIILDIHSPGGFTYVTFELMEMILAAKDVETVAFIEKDAISGAALVSLACDKIIMYPDARIGDAGEIVMGADGAYRYTEAKSRSVLCKKFATPPKPPVVHWHWLRK